MMIGYEALADHQALRAAAATHALADPGLLQPQIRPEHTEHAGRHAGRVRVGFASSYLRHHSVGRLITGVMSRLDQTRIETIALVATHFFSVDDSDTITRRLKETVDKFVLLPPNRTTAASVISAEELDVLVYPELGMDAEIYFLAFQRLAPVQMVFWGHPVSQGIPSIDYFISSDLFEGNVEDLMGDIATQAGPPGVKDSAGRYSEQLLRLDGLTTCFDPPRLPDLKSKRRGAPQDSPHLQLGLPSTAHVYLCPQTLMKFHVAFDRALRQILERDPDGFLVVVFNSNQPLWRQTLEGRWRQTLGPLIRRVRFSPSLLQEDFVRLLSVAHVMLDPYPWGGGVTSLEAFAVGTVVVTLPRQQSVVQLAAGFYRKMGLGDDLVVASNEAAFVDAACQVANDPALRLDLSARIQGAQGALYNDTSAVREWERLFLGLAFSATI